MSENADIEDFVQRACELGVTDAKIVPADSVVTAAWVRLKCQFGCDGYNRRLSCPPYTPTPQQTREVIACYRRALLVHCKSSPSTTEIVVKLEREIFLRGFYKAFGFGAGPCRLCKKCNLEECAHPEEARPSMEACGIDVYATARGNGFPIEVVRDYSDAQNHYGLILID